MRKFSTIKWAEHGPKELICFLEKVSFSWSASNCESHQRVETWDFHTQKRWGKLPDLYSCLQGSQKLLMAWTYGLTLRMKESNPDLSLSPHSLCCSPSIGRLFFKRVFFTQHPLVDGKDCGTFCSHRKARHGPHWLLLTFPGGTHCTPGPENWAG